MAQLPNSALQDCVEALLSVVERHTRALQEQRESMSAVRAEAAADLGLIRDLEAEVRALEEKVALPVPVRASGQDWEARLDSLERKVLDLGHLLDESRRTQEGLISAVQAVSSRVSMHLSSAQRQFRFNDSPAPGAPGLPSSCYLGNNRLLVRTTHNLNLLCNSGDLLMTPPLALTGMWEPDKTTLLVRYLRPGMKFLDIGANIGYFTVLGASLVTHTGRVDAFEPDPVAFQLLEHNARMNYVTHHTRLYNVALADIAGPRTFRAFENNFGAGTLSDLPAEVLADYREQPKEASVDCITLDEVYARDDVIFDVVKLNTEGSEPLVFDGGREFFRRNIHDGTIIALHFHPAAIAGIGRKPSELLESVRQQGFRVFRRVNPQEVEEIRPGVAMEMWTAAELLVTRSPFRLR